MNKFLFWVLLVAIAAQIWSIVDGFQSMSGLHVWLHTSVGVMWLVFIGAIWSKAKKSN